MKKTLNFILNNTFGIIFIIIILFYLFNISVFLFDNPGYNIIIPAIINIGLWFFIYRLLIKVKSKNEKLIPYIIFFGSALIYLIWNLYAHTQPISDYKVIVNGAKDILNGTFSAQSSDPTNYFYYYNHQIGHTVWVALEMFIVGKSLAALKILELIFLSLTNVFLYKFCKKIFSAESALIITIVYSTLFFNIAGSSIINNQHISAFFYVLALYFFVKNGNIINKILCGFLLAIAVIIRPSSIIIFIAVVLYLIWLLIKDKNKKTNIINLLLILLTYFLTYALVCCTLMWTNISKGPITENRIPYFKYILGIQWNGLYNIPTVDEVENTIYLDLKKEKFNYENYNKHSKEYIISRYLNDSPTVRGFILNKIHTFTSNPDSQADWAKQSFKDTMAGKFVIKYGYAQYVILLILSLISVLLTLKNKIKNKKDILNLFTIIFIGYFLIHIFIECQTRYRYDQYLMLAILSLPMLKITFEYIKNKLQINKIEI